MERNNLLVRKVMLLTISGFLAMLFSCAKLPPLERNDLIGEWKSDMNEVLILYADSTFEAEDMILSSMTAKYLFNGSSETKIGVRGTWEIYKTDKEYKLCLKYSSLVIKDETIEKQFGFTLSVRGSGLFENHLPWKIVSWIGDDEGISTFKKVE